jgi:hypothetical protein
MQPRLRLSIRDVGGRDALLPELTGLDDIDVVDFAGAVRLAPVHRRVNGNRKLTIFGTPASEQVVDTLKVNVCLVPATGRRGPTA